MKTPGDPPGNDIEPLGKPIRPEPKKKDPQPTGNPRIGRRIDGMLETLIPENEGNVKGSDWGGYLDLIE